MKNLKKFLFVLPAMALLFSCDSTTDFVVPGSTNYSSQDLIVNAKLSGRSVNMKEGSNIEFYGETSNNLSSEISSFKIAANITEMGEAGDYTLSDGEFEMFIEGGGSFLKGKIHGSGVKNGDEFKIVATIDIDRGEGVFEATGGELNVILSGKFNSSNHSSMDYTLNIIGKLEKVGK